MAQQTQIDVVTVWYNRAYRVEESIGSIIHQDFEGYRVFAVDDGSTDDTRARLEAMIPAARRAGVELIVWGKDNEGFTVSLKRCIEERTTAPFIGLHGSGDVSSPRRLSVLFRLLQENKEAVAAGCSVRVRSPEGRVIHTRIRDGIAPRNLVDNVIPKPATHECAVIRRKDYDAIGGYRPFFRYAQDSDLWIRLSRRGPIVNTADILFDKITIPESVSASWKKSLLQHKYSTLAIQNGIVVDRGGTDMIPLLDPLDWERSVDPRRLLQRFPFLRRGVSAAIHGRSGEAIGLAGEYMKTLGRTFTWRNT